MFNVTNQQSNKSLATNIPTSSSTGLPAATSVAPSTFHPVQTNPIDTVPGTVPNVLEQWFPVI